MLNIASYEALLGLFGGDKMDFEELEKEIGLLREHLEDIHKEFIKELKALIDEYLVQIK